MAGGRQYCGLNVFSRTNGSGCDPRIMGSRIGQKWLSLSLAVSLWWKCMRSRS